MIRHIFLLPSIYRKPFPSLRFSRFLSRRVTTPRRVWPACPRVQHLPGSRPRSCHRPRPRLGVSLALVRSSLLQCLSEIYHFLQHPFYLAHSDFYSVISFAAQGRALDLSEKSFYLFFFLNSPCTSRESASEDRHLWKHCQEVLCCCSFQIRIPRARD